MTVFSDARLICVDVDGTVSMDVEGIPIDGAAEALIRVASRFPVRFVTNATSRPHAVLLETLLRAGFPVQASQLFTPATTAQAVLTSRGHAGGLLIIDPLARRDFEWFEERPDGGAVLLATEAHTWSIADLQPAFRRLLLGAPLYTLQRNRYYHRNRQLLTDLGPLAAFLEYASETTAETLGKPSALMFDTVAARAGIPREQILMVGDDAEFDVAASVALGMRAVLVRTGKYRPGDELQVSPKPSATIDSVADLPALLGI